MANRYTWRTFLLEIFMILAAAVFLFPFYVLVLLSLKDQRAVTEAPLALPRTLNLDNYVAAWGEASLGSALLTSTLVTGGSLVLLVGLGSLAAFVLARRRGGLSYGLYLLFLLGIILPYQLGLIPLYALVRDLRLLGSPLSLLLFYTGIQLPFTVFLYTGFLRALPTEYEDSARVDGASHLQVFGQVVLPLLRPITGTVVVVNAVFVWNDFLTPLLYLSGSEYQTIPIAIYQFVGQYQSRWGLVFAGLVMSSLPILLVYFLLQRNVIQGFASGLKG